ncbi:hypothetical protein F4778DRAFT_205986 [Xylariomycetidae sp. FL2044]|nr:hypothetical protein F4778DRAFT_205986 [Xylariomycetidae sp. FL2044]
MDSQLEQFMLVTGVGSENVARGYLEISGGDAEQAITMFFENPELQASFNAPSSAATLPTSSNRSRNVARAGREDASGVIHIDSDDDDVPMSDDQNEDFVIPDDDEDHVGVAAVARTAQEEEDAAMARRLQEEMYSENTASADGVRAPIERRTETLMAPDPAWGGFDDDRHEALLEQARQRARPSRARGNRNNPFNQSSSVWGDPSESAGPARPPGGSNSRDRSARLADLFRPPHELMSHLPLDSARDYGKEEKKWIMVNLQDTSIFRCQCLNRDLWKDVNIQSLIREHFIFLQYDKLDPLAESYTTFYFPNQSHENPNNYPHVTIIDPRTGEQVKTWSGDDFPPAAEFYSDLVEFLDRYSLEANSKNPVAKSKPKAQAVDFGRLTEDEMLELALKNSLDAHGGSSSTVEDPDALTKAEDESGKGKATDTGSVAETPAEASSAVDSAFAGISSTNPQPEPDASPAATKMQFRHPSGRVIRRFLLTDHVRQLYEWLKAEPLEGKEGVPFELKAMPSGSDLISELDKSIEEVGLKSGTVMIEFIED